MLLLLLASLAAAGQVAAFRAAADRRFQASFERVPLSLAHCYDRAVAAAAAGKAAVKAKTAAAVLKIAAGATSAKATLTAPVAGTSSPRPLGAARERAAKAAARRMLRRPPTGRPISTEAGRHD